MALVATTLLSTATAASAAPVGSEKHNRVCRDVTVPVSLAPGQPANETIHGQFCVPTGQNPETIQLLVHGITYTSDYWNFPDPRHGTGRYNYTKSANKSGTATLAIDRIGSGKSSHPPSPLVNIETNAYTVHQVVQAIRHRDITSPDGNAFDNIVYVGHSYGSWVGWNEVSDYNDVDAAVFTGAFEDLTVTAPGVILPGAYPAELDPKFTGKGLDPGYVTTLPGTRDEQFYSPAKVDPEVLDYEKQNKGTWSLTELATYPLILNEPQDVRVPVFLVGGTEDSLFCKENLSAVPSVANIRNAVSGALGRVAAPFEDHIPVTQDVTGSRFGGAKCDTAQELLADEKNHMGPNAPSVDAFILPGAGHALNQALNSPDYFRATNNWITDTVGR